MSQTDLFVVDGNPQGVPQLVYSGPARIRVLNIYGTALDTISIYDGFDTTGRLVWRIIGPDTSAGLGTFQVDVVFPGEGIKVFNGIYIDLNPEIYGASNVTLYCS